MLGTGTLLAGAFIWFASHQYLTITHAENTVKASLNVKLRGRCTFVSLRRSGDGFEGVVGDTNGSTYPITASVDVHGQAHYQCALANN